MDYSFGLLGALTPAHSALFAAKDDAGAMGGMMCMCIVPFLIFGLMFAFFAIVGWKIFTKAGRPGWEALVPIYSNWILVTEICKKEPLWFFLGFVPIGNIIAAWVICQELAKKFGKSETFGIGLFFLGIIFAPMLAFGDAKYQGGRRKSRDYDDDDDDEEEEEEERPRKRRRDEDDEDEDDRPRRRRRDDDD